MTSPVYDMMVRKKMLKIQERLGMRIGISGGTSKTPVVKNTQKLLEVLEELYRIGLRAFVIPRDYFSDIDSSTDLYKTKYGDLIKVKEIAAKYGIELSIAYPDLPEKNDEILRTFCTIGTVMDARTFMVQPTFFPRMPPEQAIRLIVHKLNDVTNTMRLKFKIGIETTGKMSQVGTVEDVLEIVDRTSGTEPILNWAHIHGRGSGAMRSQADFKRIIEKARAVGGGGWTDSAYMMFSGVKYGPSGEVGHIPLDKSDINLEFLIREVMGANLRGTLIFEDPDKEKWIVKNMEKLADMVR
jgi:deoxyribonuclease-4